MAMTKPGRSMWKGQLKLSLITCNVALYKATGSTDRIAFNTLNRKTGNRLKQQMVDSVTGVVVDTLDRVKGYEVGKGQYVLIEDEELDAIRPEGDKVINLESCVRPSEVAAVYRDESYFLVPQDHVAEEAFALLRDTLAAKQLAGVGKLMLRSRQRPVIVEPEGLGLLVTTLRFASEIRSSADTFAGIRPITLAKDMLDLAGELIQRKVTAFDPAAFVDAYEQSVIEMVRAKQTGKAFAAPQEREATNVIDLMGALKQALAQEAGEGKPKGDRKPTETREGMRKAKGRSKAA